MKNMTFKDLIAKFKALPVKTRNLIFVILGIAIFLCSYMLGYQKLQEKTDLHHGLQHEKRLGQIPAEERKTQA